MRGRSSCDADRDIVGYGIDVSGGFERIGSILCYFFGEEEEEFFRVEIRHSQLRQTFFEGTTKLGDELCLRDSAG